MTAVTIRGLARTYPGRPPVAALRGVDLDLPSGSLTAVLGPSGCGKTSLLRMLAGFDRPDAGTVAFDGEVVSDVGRVVPPERRQVGIVPQEGALFPHLDVAANVAFGLRRGGEDRSGRARRVDELLELVGLAGYGSRRPHELSGGQQQRVALARALAPRPAVVLLDEPFTALDASLRGTLRADVSATLAAAGATALLVTHDQAEALTMADHLAVMRAGRIVQSGPPAEVYGRPVDAEAARFLGDAVLLPGRVEGDRVACVLGAAIPVAEAGAGSATPGVTDPPRPGPTGSGSSGSVRRGSAGDGIAPPGPVVPSMDEASVDEPSVDEPSVDEPSVDEPSVDEPSVDAPSVDAPSAGANAGGSSLAGVAAVPRGSRPGDDSKIAAPGATGSRATGGVIGSGGAVTVCLRPEQLVRCDESAVRATVVAVRYQGHDALVELVVGDESVVARWSSVGLPRSGEEVGLVVTGAAVAFAAGS